MRGPNWHVNIFGRKQSVSGERGVHQIATSVISVTSVISDNSVISDTSDTSTLTRRQESSLINGGFSLGSFANIFAIKESPQNFQPGTDFAGLPNILPVRKETKASNVRVYKCKKFTHDTLNHPLVISKLDLCICVFADNSRTGSKLTPGRVHPPRFGFCSLFNLSHFGPYLPVRWWWYVGRKLDDFARKKCPSLDLWTSTNWN